MGRGAAPLAGAVYYDRTTYTIGVNVYPHTSLVAHGMPCSFPAAFPPEKKNTPVHKKNPFFAKKNTSFHRSLAKACLQGVCARVVSNCMFNGQCFNVQWSMFQCSMVACFMDFKFCVSLIPKRARTHSCLSARGRDTATYGVHGLHYGFLCPRGYLPPSVPDHRG